MGMHGSLAAAVAAGSSTMAVDCGTTGAPIRASAVVARLSLLLPGSRWCVAGTLCVWSAPETKSSCVGEVTDSEWSMPEGLHAWEEGDGVERLGCGDVHGGGWELEQRLGRCSVGCPSGWELEQRLGCCSVACPSGWVLEQLLGCCSAGCPSGEAASCCVLGSGERGARLRCCRNADANGLELGTVLGSDAVLDPGVGAVRRSRVLWWL